MNTTVPSGSGLQKLSNKCGKIITAENEKDMCEKRKIVFSLLFTELYFNLIHDCTTHTTTMLAIKTSAIGCKFHPRCAGSSCLCIVFKFTAQLQTSSMKHIKGSKKKVILNYQFKQE